LVASVAEDAMHAVPNALREAAVGLGAHRRTTSLRVVVPAAVSGISAAFILGISRAIGETMIVAIVAGGTGGSLFSLDPLKGGQTMTAAITSLATGSDQVRGSGPAYPSLFFVGLLLFFLTLGLNAISERFVRRVRRRY
jgi:phosphate transport system permease protein